MADRYRASPLSVRLSQKDHEWLAERAQVEDVSVRALVKRAVQHFRYWQDEGEEALKQALEIFEAERSGRETERRRRLYFQREQELQSRRLHNMLRHERDLRTKRETQLRDERDYYERQAKAAGTDRNAPYRPTIAKLLTLAIRSESDAEAMTAIAKARALHRKEQYSTSDTP